MSRRELIADAGIRLIARGGTHELTHRTVDREAQLPNGSTSYYARTRQDLLTLVVQRLSDRSEADAEHVSIPERLGTDAAIRLVMELLDRMKHRADAQAARFALLFEVRDDDELRPALTAEAPVRRCLEQLAVQLLEALRVPGAVDNAKDFVALIDSLLMYQTVQAAPVDLARVIRAYLSGLRSG